jgi:hypothetical protein
MIAEGIGKGEVAAPRGSVQGIIVWVSIIYWADSGAQRRCRLN